MNYKSQTEADRSNSAADVEASHNSTTDILDYDALIERCMGNIELASRLLEKCQTCLPHEIEELDRALDVRDAEQLARTAHRLRGTTANISANGLCRAAEEIERLGKMGCLTDVSTSLEHLHEEWGRFRDYVSISCRR